MATNSESDISDSFPFNRTDQQISEIYLAGSKNQFDKNEITETIADAIFNETSEKLQNLTIELNHHDDINPTKTLANPIDSLIVSEENKSFEHQLNTKERKEMEETDKENAINHLQLHQLHQQLISVDMNSKTSLDTGYSTKTVKLFPNFNDNVNFLPSIHPSKIETDPSSNNTTEIENETVCTTCPVDCSSVVDEGECVVDGSSKIPISKIDPDLMTSIDLNSK